MYKTLPGTRGPGEREYTLVMCTCELMEKVPRLATPKCSRNGSRTPANTHTHTCTVVGRLQIFNM